MSDKMTGNEHWSEKKEPIPTYFFMRVMIVLFHFLPMVFVRLFVFPVTVAYYFAVPAARSHSRDYLNRINAFRSASGLKRKRLYVFWHLYSFALELVEKMESWGGKVPYSRIHFTDDDINDLKATLEEGRGAMLICSHLGNAELLRALADMGRTGVSRKVDVVSIVDFSVMEKFNRMMREINPDSMMHILSANSVGPDTVIQLQEHLEKGGLVVIAGDRTSANSRNRFFVKSFLGKPAPFSIGPYLLACLLCAPTYYVFGIRNKDIMLFPEYTMYVKKAGFDFNCPRKQRNLVVESCAAAFIKELERHCIRHPYQWYNFYNFWALSNTGAKEN